MAVSRWVLDGSKFLSTGEVRRLLDVARARTKATAHRKAKHAVVREYFIVHLGLATGLRVGEMARLRCGDFAMGGGMSSLMVLGKGDKTRVVSFSDAFRGHVLSYLQWKAEADEPVCEDAPVFLSSVTKKSMTRSGIQKAFKRCAARAGLSGHFSIHSLRHTYACHLYKASGWNLRLVQKQLGHSNIATTQVYADVMDPDMRRALERLYQ